MLAPVLVHACIVFGHTPSFPKDNGHIIVDAEPSGAIYMRPGKTTFTFNYEPSDPIYTTVFVLKRDGHIYRDAYGRTNANDHVNGHGLKFNYPVVEKVTECSSDARGQELKQYHVGDDIYEPFGETRLVVASEVYSGEFVANRTMACMFTVESRIPYVVSHGKEEEIVGTILIGLPIILMKIAAWQGAYVYGWLFLATLPLVAAIASESKHLLLYITSAIFMLSAINRWMLVTWGGAFPTGILFSLIPTTFAVAIHAERLFPRRKTCLRIFIWLCALIAPTKSWVDIISLTFAYTLT